MCLAPRMLVRQLILEQVPLVGYGAPHLPHFAAGTTKGCKAEWRQANVDTT
jgi:hypothetical protein